MILRDYSEPQRLGLDMDAPCATLGWPNMVLCGRAADVSYPEHSGRCRSKPFAAGVKSTRSGGHVSP